MPPHHEPFKALRPIAWSDLPQDDLTSFLRGVFSKSQTVIESIPSTSPTAASAASSASRPRAQTDSAVTPAAAQQAAPIQDPAALEHAQALRKEWKEVKVNPRDNPRNVTVYKLGAKDGRGAWFARRSVHDGPDFDSWKAAFQAEFHESMKTQGSPGSGNIRGIGADELVEDCDLQEAGHIQVFHLSAQFPGPTAPRDFITLFMTTEFSHTTPPGARPLREFMVVSRPCEHEKTPPQDGIIRGHYESVEIVREIPADGANPRRSTAASDSRSERVASASASTPQLNQDADIPTNIEWLMVTRSDPGGSVPRFMIERGTPPGIVGDTEKFIKWMDKRSRKQDTSTEGGQTDETVSISSAPATEKPNAADADSATYSRQPADVESTTPYPADGEDAPQYSSGLYSMITGALGAAGSYVAEGIQRQFTTAASFSSQEEESDAPTNRAHDDSESDASSENSFSSALERYLTEENANGAEASEGIDNSDLTFPANQLREKELKRLQERRKKLDDKVAQMQERMMQKKDGDQEKDAAQIAKARDKHEKDIAKQEAKYRRELEKIEEKRAQEMRKAEQRRRKAEEKDKKNNLTVELEKTRTERDIALKQIEILEHQVGELQAQNTMLVAKMGRLAGLGGDAAGRARSDSASSKSLHKSSQKSAP